jgi:hypothetical protein
MAFFRSYLKEIGIIPDPRFDETDEDVLVQFLLQARIRGSVANLEIKTGFFGRRELYRDLADPKAKDALKFVAGFLCHFVTKPVGYQREMEDFKQYFIPGFAKDRSRQARLARGLREEFFHTALESLETAETLDLYFDISELNAATGATG